ncbi:hypothetical protein FIBSPDRAFT_298638 [Athelia psychrophila]|uniref:Uncharacterized protein n=1 Tax=Athelia psychrophila TaxID=1759441 RepID=A0A166QUT2_9AGAM|nr:hypothetical protein FIBSPDRAFT_298638 [Fibularhizoctonia sp. CBS 109695]
MSPSFFKITMPLMQSLSPSNSAEASYGPRNGRGVAPLLAAWWFIGAAAEARLLPRTQLCGEREVCVLQTELGVDTHAFKKTTLTPTSVSIQPRRQRSCRGHLQNARIPLQTKLTIIHFLLASDVSMLAWVFMNSWQKYLRLRPTRARKFIWST